MNKPDYLFRCEIIDRNNGDRIVAAGTYPLAQEKTKHDVFGMEVIDETDAELEFHAMCRGFRYHQAEYERVNYPEHE